MRLKWPTQAFLSHEKENNLANEPQPLTTEGNHWKMSQLATFVEIGMGGKQKEADRKRWLATHN